jgi:phosphomannomutase
MDSLKFGTSGLRGLVTDLTNAACQLYTRAFIAHLRANGALDGAVKLLVGYDLRDSSPAIAAACIAAANETGLTAIDCGPLPTPALALEAARLGVPAIMVTGSHIPADRNGLKFYRADGEIDKADEAGILRELDRVAGQPLAQSSPGNPSSDALMHYLARYSALAGGVSLQGMRIGVYQHSSVARDILVKALSGLGAETLPLGRATGFVPVDTEALRPEDVELARDWAAEHRIDAIVSTDGDADRPLIADEHGVFLRGDIVGLLTARFLSADAVVTPVTSTSSIEYSELFPTILRTRVGSPYVIEGMVQAGEAGARIIVGFEANGGVLLGSTIAGKDIQLAALPTRDALLPIIAVLALARSRKLSLSKLVDSLPPRYTASDRLKDTPSELSNSLLAKLGAPDAFAGSFVADIGTIEALNTTDGVQIKLGSGDLIHFRASGNAPELRCYTEASTPDRARNLLQWGLAKARSALGNQA